MVRFLSGTRDIHFLQNVHVAFFESSFGADSVIFLGATPRELTVLMTVVKLHLLLQESYFYLLTY